MACTNDPQSEKWNWKRFVLGECDLDCACVHHEIARAWLDASKDSHVTDVTMVRDADRAANYLVKYLTKTFATAWDQEVKHRRWAKSNNWPKMEKLQMRGTAEAKWREVIIIPKAFDEKLEQLAEQSEEEPLMERVGLVWLKDRQLKKAKLGAKIVIERVLNADL